MDIFTRKVFDKVLWQSFAVDRLLLYNPDKL